MIAGSDQPLTSRLLAEAADRVRTVRIADVARSAGWTESDWQYQLMLAADRNALDSRGRPASDGTTSVAKIRAYVKQPVDLLFLASSTLARLREQFGPAGLELPEHRDEQPQPIEVTSLARLGDPVIYELAKEIAGSSRYLTEEALDAYLLQVKQQDEDQHWLPNQHLDVMLSCVAGLTGEVDHLKPANVTLRRRVGDREQLTLEYPKTASRTAFDPEHRIPRWASYTVHFADRLEVAHSGEPARVSRFMPNPRLEQALIDALGDSVVEVEPQTRKPVPHQATKDVYPRSGFDQGHCKPADAAASDISMRESNEFDNISPQRPEFNRQSLRMLEAGNADLVEGVKGRAVVFTTNLFIEERDGRPDFTRRLDESEIEWLVHDAEGKAQVRTGTPTGGERLNAKTPPIAIPSHVATMVLLTQQDGALSMYTYALPNRADIPTLKRDIIPWLERHRASVDQMEAYFGEDFFSQLKRVLIDPDSGQGRNVLEKLEADAQTYIPMFEEQLAERMEKLARERQDEPTVVPW